MSKFSSMSLPTEKPERMTILHPTTRQPLRTKDGAEAYIDIYSADSEIKRKHDRAVTQRRLSVRGRMKLTVAELEAEGLELLALLTAGWRLVSLAGELIDVPLTVENARELYADAGMSWLREQVDEFASDRANFSKASSTT